MNSRVSGDAFPTPHFSHERQLIDVFMKLLNDMISCLVSGYHRSFSRVRFLLTFR